MKGCPWMWVKHLEAVLITWSGCSSLAVPVPAPKEERNQDSWGGGAKGVKMTLLEITTATLNVLHYKICDKTFLWVGP